jgi:LemA protein
MKAFILGLVVFIILGVIYFVSTYNGLVTANEQIDGQWAQVESQYQRRFDLIPNLVSTVKGFMNQEQIVFGAIADARTKYAGAVTVDEKVAATNQVESALGRLLVIMENYPQLKSDSSVQTLLTQLEGAENRISVERMRFNEYVQKYNIHIKKVPTVWIASVYGFDPRTYFEATEGSEVAPIVDLNNQ